MLAVGLGNDGLQMSISFNIPTNMGGKSMRSLFRCTDLFVFISFNGGRIYGTGLLCQWVTSALVTVTWPTVSLDPSTGKLSTILPESDDTVTLKPAVMRAACNPLSSTRPISDVGSSKSNNSSQSERNNSTTTSGGSTSSVCKALVTSNATSLKILPPRNPLSPQPFLSAPSKTGDCSSVDLDPTGSYGNLGRPWVQVTWLVNEVGNDGIATPALAIQSFLNAVGNTTSKVT